MDSSTLREIPPQSTQDAMMCDVLLSMYIPCTHRVDVKYIKPENIPPTQGRCEMSK